MCGLSKNGCLSIISNFSTGTRTAHCFAQNCLSVAMYCARQTGAGRLCARTRPLKPNEMASTPWSSQELRQPDRSKVSHLLRKKGETIIFFVFERGSGLVEFFFSPHSLLIKAPLSHSFAKLFLPFPSEHQDCLNQLAAVISVSSSISRCLFCF